MWRACSASAFTSRVHALDESHRLATPSASRQFALCHRLPPRERRPGRHGSRRAKNPLNRAPLTDSLEPQHHRELLHVRDHTVIAFLPQVELTVSAAPPGLHDRRR